MLLRQLHHQGLQGWRHLLEVRGGFVQLSMQLHGCFGYVQKSLCFFHLFLQRDLAWRSFNLFALGSNLGNQLQQRLGHFSFFSLLLLAALSFWDAGEKCSSKQFFTQLIQQLFQILLENPRPSSVKVSPASAAFALLAGAFALGFASLFFFFTRPRVSQSVAAMSSELSCSSSSSSAIVGSAASLLGPALEAADLAGDPCFWSRARQDFCFGSSCFLFSRSMTKRTLKGFAPVLQPLLSLQEALPHHAPLSARSRQIRRSLLLHSGLVLLPACRSLPFSHRKHLSEIFCSNKGPYFCSFQSSFKMNKRLGVLRRLPMVLEVVKVAWAFITSFRRVMSGFWLCSPIHVFKAARKLLWLLCLSVLSTMTFLTYSLILPYLAPRPNTQWPWNTVSTTCLLVLSQSRHSPGPWPSCKTAKASW